MTRQSVVLAAASALVISSAACSDSSSLPTVPGPGLEAAPVASESAGMGVFHRYVAIGTSVTMGVQSDGVVGDLQRQSWAAQLARLAGRELELPLISGYGCGSPLRERLITFARTRPGEGAGTAFDSRQCDPNEAGVSVATGNVAVDGATTLDALRSTAATKTGLRSLQYDRVLGPDQTQVGAMLAQNPKIVSVELGANDIMGVRTGFYQQGRTVFPLATWKTLYAQVVDAVESNTKHAILVGLIDDALEFPGFRTGAEIWSQAAVLRQAFNVEVDPNCGLAEADAENVLFVPIKVVGAIGEGLQRRQRGPAFGAAALSCADDPANDLAKPDYVLTPADVRAANLHVAEMNAYIRQQADARGFAHVELEAIFGRPDAKPAFDVYALMMSPTPYGPYVSLDGIHPNGEGARVLADAAALALNARYRLGLPTSAASVFAVARP